MAIQNKRLQVWLAPTASLCFVALAAVFTFSKQRQAAANIRELQRGGADLCQAAERARTGFVPAPEAARIAEAAHDLELRMAEAAQPGLVQAELMASARKAGLDIREVQPASPTHYAGKAAGPRYPSYRVSVQGGYPQIAEFMQICKAQRVPGRLTSFRLAPVVDETGKPINVLRAEIAVDAFRLSDKEDHSGK